MLIRKLISNGSSVLITVPQSFLKAHHLRPGAFVQVVQKTDGNLTVAPLPGNAERIARLLRKTEEAE